MRKTNFLCEFVPGMIGERSELLARLLRYNQLVRSMTDAKAREALRAAISGIERQLADLDRASLQHPPTAPQRAQPYRAR